MIGATKTNEAGTLDSEWSTSADGKRRHIRTAVHDPIAAIERGAIQSVATFPYDDGRHSTAEL